MVSGRGKKKHEAGYGRGTVWIAMDDALLLDDDEVTRRLLEVFSSPEYRPPTLPSVATNLLALSQNPNVRIEDVTDLLERDSMITGRVMKLVRSPLYAGRGEIPTLNNAVLRLGLDTLRDIVLEACMNMKVFRSDAFTETMERLRRHSTFTGHLTRIVCRYTAIDGEFAFLAGLLHDVGVAGSLIALAEGVPKDRRPNLMAIWPAIDRVHPRAGALMLKLWDLPAELQLAIDHHHQVLVEGYAHPLSAAICLADALAQGLGQGLFDADAEEDDLATACLRSHTELDQSLPGIVAKAKEALGLSPEQLELIDSDARALLEKLG